MKQPVYLGSQRLLLTTSHGSKLLCPSDDLSVSLELAASGTFEAPLTKYFLQHVQPGHTILDLGAHIGYYSVLFGRLIGPTGKLFAYEAHPRAYAFLMDNLSINDLHDRTRAYHRAVYSCETTLPFYASKRYLGNSSIHQHHETYLQHYVDEFETISIDTVVLDDHLRDLESIDFIKMDMEGSEYQAFVGMERIIREQAKTVVFEVNRSMLHDDWDAFVSLLRSYRHQFNKQFYVITQEGSTVEMDLEIILSSGECPYLVMC
ncbi:FkbM family methyltransferase [Brevibacillus choshinensis]|uniref:FkbM family methyltransferase n=1 Tax=Brevibacillus choshinensis TaxID=54911 RepID=UPI002E220EFE|nr:FkbM family methyltransferase [Brevibacillus choshinensis]MED4583395.1 FkbM family methyltransferase [Brevibacillus choshinensis]MED4752680.1 FkbM family methyltransferase [Brevibacillus choshinensis]MED4782719.1 FkbM family methyltransferase [Brevibacillus choshinensis]